MRAAAVILLAIAAASVGVWCGLRFRQPSIAFLGFVAFLAVAAPVVLSIPTAAWVKSSQGVILMLILPVVAFAATRLWFRATANSDEPIIGLLLVFACALLLAGLIASSLVASRTDLRANCSSGDHGLGAYVSFVFAGALIWLTFRGNLVSHALWISLFLIFVGVAILLSRAFIRPQLRMS
jgi:hypothetical protein